MVLIPRFQRSLAAADGGGGGDAVPTGAIAFYDCEAFVGGVLTDQSGNGKDGLAVGAITIDTDAAIGGGSIYTASTGKYINFDASDPFTSRTSTEISISLWVKYTSTGTMYIFTHTPNDGNWRVLTAGGLIKAEVIQYTTSRVQTTLTGPATNDGAWHHVVASFERGGTFALYVDGVLEDSASVPDADFESFYDPDYFSAFCARQRSSGGPTEYFQGRIDQVRIYDRALTSDETAALYAERVV